MAASKQQAQPASLPEALLNRANAKLVFSDGTTLPANADLLAIHSNVLAGLLSGEVDLKKDGEGAVLIPLDADEKPEAWILLLRVLYLVESLSWGNIVQLMDKYGMEGPRPIVKSYMLATNLDNSPETWPKTVWVWLVAAARCNLPAVVDKCCKYISAKRLRVPQGLELGPAAQPLAEWLSRCLAEAKGVADKEVYVRQGGSFGVNMLFLTS